MQLGTATLVWAIFKFLKKQTFFSSRNIKKISHMDSTLWNTMLYTQKRCPVFETHKLIVKLKFYL